MAYKHLVIAAALVNAAWAGLLAGAPLAYAAHPAPYGFAAPTPAFAAPPHAFAAPAVVAKTAVLPAAKAVAVSGPDADFDPNPQYSYAYDIQDALTGDNKGQQETRNGDVVQGSYTLVEADGSRRTVEYTADPVNGFNAVVHREGAVVGGKALVGPPVAKVAAPYGFAPLHTKAVIG